MYENQIICDEQLQAVGPFMAAEVVQGNYIERGEWNPSTHMRPIRILSKRSMRISGRAFRRDAKAGVQAFYLGKNPTHAKKVRRCIRYGDRIPRKYLRRYKEAIKFIKKWDI